MITVKSGLADKSRIALFEQHKAHPNGEVVVTGDGKFLVGETAEIMRALGEGRLVKVDVEVAQQVASVEPEPTEEEPRHRRKRE